MNQKPVSAPIPGASGLQGGPSSVHSDRTPSAGAGAGEPPSGLSPLRCHSSSAEGVNTPDFPAAAKFNDLIKILQLDVPQLGRTLWKLQTNFQGTAASVAPWSSASSHPE